MKVGPPSPWVTQVCLATHSNHTFIRYIDELFIDVFANRLIRAGEELTIDYQMTLWFDPVAIEG